MYDILLYSVGFSPIYLIASLALQSFCFMKLNLSIFILNYWVNKVLFKNSFSTYIMKGTAHIFFSSIAFSVSGFVFGSLMYLELVLCNVIDTDLISLFHMWISSFPSIICGRCFLFSRICYLHLCLKLND